MDERIAGRRKNRNGASPRSYAKFVMPGLVPGIHVFVCENKTWMAGTSPAMTRNESSRRRKSALLTMREGC
jgi:hypothetical protein